MSKNTASVLNSVELQGVPTPEIQAFNEAVAIATAAAVAAAALEAENKAVAIATADNLESLRITKLSADLADLLKKGDSIADSALEVKRQYGDLTKSVTDFLTPLIREDVGLVVSDYLNNLSGDIGKYVMKSRKNCIKTCFKKAFTGYNIDFEFSQRTQYRVFIEEDASEESKAIMAFQLALDKLVGLTGGTPADIRADIRDTIDAYFESKYL